MNIKLKRIVCSIIVGALIMSHAPTNAFNYKNALYLCATCTIIGVGARIAHRWFYKNLIVAPQCRVEFNNTKARCSKIQSQAKEANEIASSIQATLKGEGQQLGGLSQGLESANNATQNLHQTHQPFGRSIAQVGTELDDVSKKQQCVTRSIKSAHTETEKNKDGLETFSKFFPSLATDMKQQHGVGIGRLSGILRNFNTRKKNLEETHTNADNLNRRLQSIRTNTNNQFQLQFNELSKTPTTRPTTHRSSSSLSSQYRISVPPLREIPVK